MVLLSLGFRKRESVYLCQINERKYLSNSEAIIAQSHNNSRSEMSPSSFPLHTWYLIASPGTFSRLTIQTVSRRHLATAIIEIHCFAAFSGPKYTHAFLSPLEKPVSFFRAAFARLSVFFFANRGITDGRVLSVGPR